MLPKKGRFVRSSALFVRFLGLIYVAAFLSFGAQAEGLVGADGILPIEATMAAVQRGGYSYANFPTVFHWLSAELLTVHWGAGALAGLLIAFGVAQSPLLFLAWLLYLSLAVVGRDFMAFQWDNLLLEAGLLAVFLPPLRWRNPVRGLGPSNPFVVVALQVLLLRLLFSSGYVKYASGDSAWRELTALQVHFETQPLPTALGYFWHQLPAAWHQICAAGVFVGQLILPFGLFGPARVRRWCGGLLAGFQVLILLTGNYGFFNLLTLGLCLLAIDDAAWASRIRWFSAAPISDERGEGIAATLVARSATVRTWLVAGAIASAGLGALGALQLGRTLGLRTSEAAQVALRRIQPFRSVNAYGLFAVMTKTRPEIRIEGSADGVEWRPYVFRYKAGPLTRRPEQIAPHLPRLDWVMWFAALDLSRKPRWYGPFTERLFAGSVAVRDLLGPDPFDGTPPRFLRASVRRYRFSALAAWREQGRWWDAGPARPYHGVWTAPDRPKRREVGPSRR